MGIYYCGNTICSNFQVFSDLIYMAQEVQIDKAPKGKVITFSVQIPITSTSSLGKERLNSMENINNVNIHMKTR